MYKFIELACFYPKLAKIVAKKFKNNKYEVLNVIFILKVCIQERENAFILTQNSCRTVQLLKI